MTTPNKKYSGIKFLIHKRRSKKTILSVKGSRIIPNLETRLYLRATIPSNESLNPINAIIIINEM